MERIQVLGLGCLKCHQVAGHAQAVGRVPTLEEIKTWLSE
jgi:hypothetical protein